MLRDLKSNINRSLLTAGTAALIAGLCVPVAFAQYRDYDHDRYGRLTRIEPGTQISVRTERRIDVDQFNNQQYPARVESDVYGENGRLAIPAGAPAMLMVRVAPDNDLVLDLQSVTVHGDTFGLETRPDRIESEPLNGIVGAIAGAAGVQVRGPAVDVPRDTVLTFSIQRPLVIRSEGYGRDYDRDYDRQ